MSARFTTALREDEAGGEDGVVAADGRLCSLGASGSGKSSLLEIMGTLSRPDSGRVIFDGIDLAAASGGQLTRVRRNRIGFVFQSANLIPYMTARQNVELPLRYQRMPPRQRRRAADHWLDRVGLGGRGDTRVSRLSGGERQRVAVARAMVTHPALVLADEPTGSLDHATGRQILGLLMELVDEGRSLVMVTHDRSHAGQFDQVLEMRQGRLGAPCAA